MRELKSADLVPEKPTEDRSKAKASWPSLAGCIVSLGILILILLPGLQEIRETARRSDCSNRIRMQTLAAHNYHDAYKRLPTTLCATGAIHESDWNESSNPNYKWHQQHTSTLGMLHPFMELANLSFNMDPIQFNVHRNYANHFDESGKQIFHRFWEIPDYWNFAFTDVPHLTCPADTVNEAQSFVIVATQPIHQGDLASPSQDLMTAIAFQWPSTAPDGKTDYMGRTNYMACTGANSGGRNRTGVHRNWVGCLGPRETRTLEHIPDGTSNTIMHGESLGEIKYNQATHRYERLYTHSHFTGGMARGRGSVPLNEPLNSRAQVFGDSKRSSWTGFGSRHRVGVNFTFADGACRMLTRDIDRKVFYSLCAENDKK